MPQEQAPSFQFYPRELLTSRAVLTMSLDARGAYLLLLCHAWLSEEPGTLPNDDSLLATLSGAGSRWPELREQVARAFDVTEHQWRQLRMIEARKAQKRRYDRARKGADITNKRRIAPAPDTNGSEPTATAPSFAFASSSSSASAKKETEHMSDSRRTPARVRRAKPERQPEPEPYPAWYAVYPRHEKRSEGAEAYRAALLRAGSDSLVLLAGARRYAAAVRERGLTPDKIALPASWLNADRWTDEYAPVGNGVPEAADPLARARQLMEEKQNAGA